MTGEASRAAVQQLRHGSDALITGINTVLLDDPLLKDLRKETAFSEVLTAASNCQAVFKEGRQ